jgi:hypothetical protein
MSDVVYSAIEDVPISVLIELAQRTLSLIHEFSEDAPTSSKIDQIKSWDKIEKFDIEYEWLEDVCKWSVS